MKALLATFKERFYPKMLVIEQMVKAVDVFCTLRYLAVKHWQKVNFIIETENMIHCEYRKLLHTLACPEQSCERRD